MVKESAQLGETAQWQMVLFFTICVRHKIAMKYSHGFWTLSTIYVPPALVLLALARKKTKHPTLPRFIYT